MGRYQYIAYSVGFDPDHDHNFVIKSDFLPDPVWERFKEQILGSVKTDYITDALNPDGFFLDLMGTHYSELPR